MALSSDLISQFVKLTNDKKETTKNTTVYGTVVESDGTKWVRLDGSPDGMLTPIDTTTEVEDGDRVTVDIKDHTATVTGNLTTPSINKESSVDNGNGTSTKISDLGIAIADKVSAKELKAEVARIEKLEANDVEITGKLSANEASINEIRAGVVNVEGELNAAKAEIKDLDADVVNVNKEITAAKAKIETLEATDADFRTVEADYANFKSTTTANLEAKEADISKLKTDKLDAAAADIKYATIEKLEATNASVDNLKSDHAEFETATANRLTAIDAEITELDTKKLSAEDAKLKFANIDFSNIGEAAVKKLFTDSGIIKDLVVSEGHITGELVGVTIKGDLIEAGTLKADRLVVKGSDGIYYKLNIESGATTSEEVSEEDLKNGLHGDTIIAHTITAEKIHVDDLIAFGATIGNFKIGTNAIYSGVKSSVDNTTRGIYLDTDGQAYIGDADNFLKFYKASDGAYKLEISADTMRFGSSKKTVTEAIDEVKSDIDTVRDEITTLLRIESSRGTVFKNDQVATVLSVVIYHGKQRITDSDAMKSVFGNSAYLQWKWQRLDDESFGVLSAGDSRFGDNGFTFTLSPEDVDTKVTFMCELIT